MSIQKIGSLFIQVSQLERSIAFYRDSLGLVCRGIENWGDGRRGATLFFDPHPDHAALLTLEEVEQVNASSLVCPSFNLTCENASELHQNLLKKGVRVTELETWESPWNRHLMFNAIDPDGHQVHLIEMIPLASTNVR